MEHRWLFLALDCITENDTIPIVDKTPIITSTTSSSISEKPSVALFVVLLWLMRWKLVSLFILFIFQLTPFRINFVYYGLN